MEMSAHGHPLHLPNEWESDTLVTRQSDLTIFFFFFIRAK